jgi:mannose-6-phosphate isomerase-like protein (cupin superfamily)
MKVAKAWEDEGVVIGAPFIRRIKVLFAPDKDGVEELTFSHALIPPGSQTDYHVHDRGELIYIVRGRGTAVCEGEEMPIQEDMVFWVEAGEHHQMKNTGTEELKLATVFVPPYTAEANYKRCVDAAQEN